MKIDQNKLPLGIQESLYKLIAIFLSNSTIGEIINKKKRNSLYGISGIGDKYENLMKAWENVETVIDILALEGVKDYNLLPEPVQPDLKTTQLNEESRS